MHSEKTRIPKQKRSIARKRLIKKTALRLFSEKGYSNVSTNEIAKAANVSIGSLYSYFPN
ncbi:TetR/AcrR family transcriptional regulator [Pseudoramibacter faecis]|uniref:TetR/AcrR family transcriptional regulator n=1 Tax=Pseudoramibacter faecis TaxID=3108534 RepID=UPI002E762FB0|nr:TetR/AcrR family transcriptional regulator [Pseudoramibacter sp. HA2172]